MSYVNVNNNYRSLDGLMKEIFNEFPSTVEGVDADNLTSTRARANENHRLSFTIRRKGRTPDQLFTADLSQLTGPEQSTVISQNISDVHPGNRLVSQWAQVDWFLDRSRMATINGVDTWPLIRRIRTVGTTNTPLTSAQDTLSVSPGGQLNTVQSLALLTNRLTNSGRNAASISSVQVGDDIVITNVTSFEVKAMWTVNSVPGARTTLPFGAGVPNGDYPFDDLPVSGDNTTLGSSRTFDTMSSTGNWNTPGNATSIPNRIRVQAVQIKIRVYDAKNKLSRQTTLVVKL